MSEEIRIKEVRTPGALPGAEIQLIGEDGVAHLWSADMDLRIRRSDEIPEAAPQSNMPPMSPEGWHGGGLEVETPTP
jgi:hypothetical protein